MTRGASVLASLLNLVCERGHRWFSPTPEVFADGVHGCGYQVEQVPGRPPKVCQEKLRLLPRREEGSE